MLLTHTVAAIATATIAAASRMQIRQVDVTVGDMGRGTAVVSTRAQVAAEGEAWAE